MKKASDGEAEPRGTSAAAGSQTARILTILGVNVALVFVAVLFAATRGGKLPDLAPAAFAVGLLPVSAAMGLMLACRRIDFSLPVLLVLALGLQGDRHAFSADPFWRLAAVCGIAGGVGLTSALVTWYGRVSSALWTGILGFGLWLLLGVLKVQGSSPGPWPWPWALAMAVVLLAAGAAILGVTGLVSLPSMPPIIRSGSKGVVGLAGAWVFAGAAVALASQSEAAKVAPGDLQAAYPGMLAAAALGGAYILRGRWGALTAVLLTGTAHLAWSYVWAADLGSPAADVLVPAAGPLAAILLYLFIDWAIRRRTGESAPTGLLA